MNLKKTLVVVATLRGHEADGHPKTFGVLYILALPRAGTKWRKYLSFMLRTSKTLRVNRM